MRPASGLIPVKCSKAPTAWQTIIPPPAWVLSSDSARKQFGALAVPVDDEELLHSERHRGVGDGRTRAPGAKEHHAPPRCIAQLPSEGHGESRAIGVEAFAPAFAEDHRVDGADGARVL